MTNSVELLKRFIALWESVWKDPNDPSHQYREFYQYAVAIVGIENNIQEDIAAWLLSELDERWDFDDGDGTDEDELNPDWAKLHHDIKDYLHS